ncbi:hypothetical protein FA95DRAFT_1575489 [Auriscalpium vulgare]|uniref:Uncharacterized protein n=1 Tax=Auriscalpium vulgare TaxID=40419 RepID=A0ACB8RFZ1_9AGAM|nr:hypothetical protein FA95DRAFT_1575489 [Auriscalpium vulgare]
MFSRLWVPPGCEPPPPVTPTLAVWWASLPALHRNLGICIFLVFAILLLLFVIGFFNLRRELHILQKARSYDLALHAARSSELNSAVARATSTQGEIQCLQRLLDTRQGEFQRLQRLFDTVSSNHRAVYYAHRKSLSTIAAGQRWATDMNAAFNQFAADAQCGYDALLVKYEDMMAKCHKLTAKCKNMTAERRKLMQERQADADKASIKASISSSFARRLRLTLPLWKIHQLRITLGALGRALKVVKERMGWEGLLIHEEAPDWTTPAPAPSPVNIDSALKNIASLNDTIRAQGNLIHVQTMTIELLEKERVVAMQQGVDAMQKRNGEFAYILQETETLLRHCKCKDEVEATSSEKDKQICLPMDGFRGALSTLDDESSTTESSAGEATLATAPFTPDLEKPTALDVPDAEVCLALVRLS